MILRLLKENELEQFIIDTQEAFQRAMKLILESVTILLSLSMIY